jgi:hypothetical protein
MLVLLLLAVMAVIVALTKGSSKGSWVAGIIALVILSMFAVAFFFKPAPHRRVEHVVDNVYQRAQPTGPEDAKAIWLPGIEDEFEANLYPSKLSAVRSLGLRVGEPIQQLFGDQQWPNKGILFQGNHDRDLLDEFIKTAARTFPQTQWTIAPETVAVQPNEVGVRLDLSQTGPAPWQSSPESNLTRGTFRASVLAGSRQTSINAEFEEKPWIENFYGAWNNQPNRQLIVAKSAESCLTEGEANSQAIADACNQLTKLLRETSQAQATPTLPRNVTSNDILEGDFIDDRFAQNFDGRAGKIWRQALLIDASVGKLEELAHHKTAVARAKKWSWARMVGSVVGLLALITVVYAFLNAATKGYYAWSLRIAGIVLAAAVIILFVA